MDRTETNEMFIKCECEQHILHATSIIDYIEDTSNNSIRYRQDIYLAIFNHGGPIEDNIFRRILVAFRYIFKKKIYSDNIIMTPKEASKLAEFIDNNLVEKRRPLKYTAKCLQHDDNCFNEIIVVYDENGKELARSQQHHPEGYKNFIYDGIEFFALPNASKKDNNECYYRLL